MKRKSFQVVKVNLTSPQGGSKIIPAKNLSHACVVLRSFLSRGYTGYVTVGGKKV